MVQVHNEKHLVMGIPHNMKPITGRFHC